MLYMLLLLAHCHAQRTDELLTESTNVEETNCKGYLKPACQLCSATQSYQIPSSGDFSIEGQYKSVLKTAQQAVFDMQFNLQANEYNFIPLNRGFCLVASGYDQYPDLVDFYERTMNVEYHQLNDPEIFAIQPDIDFVLTRFQLGEGTGFYYDKIWAQFSAEETAISGDRIQLDLQGYTVTLSPNSQDVLYFGQATLGQQAISTDFTIQVEYEREPLDSFNVTLSGKGQLGPWVDAMSASSKCSEIRSPIGIGNFSKLPINYSQIFYSQNNTSSGTYIVKSSNYVDLPKFALAPGLRVKQGTGMLDINFEQNLCELEITGTLEGLGKEFEFQMSLDKGDAYKMGMEGRYDPKKVDIWEIQELVNSFYTDPRSIIPRIRDEPGQLYDILENASIFNPNITVYFEEELHLAVQGQLQIAASGRGSFQLYVSRVNGLIESYFDVQELDMESMIKLTNEEMFRTGILLENGSLSAVTGAFAPNDHFAMVQSGIIGDTPFQPGLQFNANLQKTKSCQYDELCTLLDNSELLSANLQVNGFYNPSLYQFTTSLQNLAIEDIIMFTDGDLQLLVQQEPYYQYRGNFQLQGDSKAALNFTGNVTSIAGDAVVNGRLTDIWQGAFDIENLDVYQLDLNGDINSQGILINSVLSGWGAFSCDDNPMCWSGLLTTSLHPNDYIENYFVMNMDPQDSLQAYKSLGIDAQGSGLASSLKIESGITLTYSYKEHTDITKGMTLEGNVLLIDLSCQAIGTVSSDLTYQLTIPNFTTGFNNIQITSGTDESIQGTFHLDNRSSGTVTADIKIFGISDSSTISFDDNTIQFSISGNPFQGVYILNFQLSAGIPESWDSAIWAVQAQFSDVDLESANSNLQTRINQWANAGSDALSYIKNLRNSLQTTLEDLNSQKCNEPCPSTQICNSTPISTCQTYAFRTTCIENRPGCDQFPSTCIDSSTICIRERTYCKRYVPNLPDICAEYDTECASDIVNCSEWQTECVNPIFGGCQSYQVSTMYNLCLEEAIDCDWVQVEDPECQGRCQYIEAQIDAIQEELSSIELNYSEIAQKLQGFAKLKDILNSGPIVSIESASVNQTILESGFGPGDLKMRMSVSFYDLGNDFFSLEDIEVDIDWFDVLGTQRNLFKQVRELIVSRASGRIGDALTEKSPAEFLQEYIQRPVSLQQYFQKMQQQVRSRNSEQEAVNASRKALRQIFLKHCHTNSSHISYQEFLHFCKQVHIFPNLISSLDIKRVLNKLSQNQTVMSMALNFTGFVEVLKYIALQCFPNYPGHSEKFKVLIDYIKAHFEDYGEGDGHEFEKRRNLVISPTASQLKNSRRPMRIFNNRSSSLLISSHGHPSPKGASGVVKSQVTPKITGKPFGRFFKSADLYKSNSGGLNIVSPQSPVDDDVKAISRVFLRFRDNHEEISKHFLRAGEGKMTQLRRYEEFVQRVPERMEFALGLIFNAWKAVFRKGKDNLQGYSILNKNQQQGQP